jgi:hypothetical protein
MDGLAPKETMDRMLVYRNLLCAEDHLDEIFDAARSSDELEMLKNWKIAIEGVRSSLGFKEVDHRYHCLTKHLALAYEAAREVAKATHSESDFETASLLRSYLTMSLERLLCAKIENCARCKEEHEQRIEDEQTTGGRASIESDADASSESEDVFTAVARSQKR